jgi:hypothetical protein
VIDFLILLWTFLRGKIGTFLELLFVVDHVIVEKLPYIAMLQTFLRGRNFVALGPL